MLDVPASFIVSSKLSPLQPEDVDRLVQLVQTCWNDRCVAQLMHIQPPRPLVAAGIANPQDLTRVMTTGVPVIHLERECEALQSAQRKHWREIKRQQGIGYISSASVWGACGALCTVPWKRAWLDDGRLPAPVIYGGTTMAVVGLGLYTAQLLRSLRYNYTIVHIDHEHFLLRDDALQSAARYLLKTLAPYCLLVVASYSLCRHRLLTAH
ncbi:hypothetical protein BC940DRAFT_234513 [Gongronella butleri]|nr:hypothetical protein BC940DRAFT_234513 [Gongronella butleri]